MCTALYCRQRSDQKQYEYAWSLMRHIHCVHCSLYICFCCSSHPDMTIYSPLQYNIWKILSRICALTLWIRSLYVQSFIHKKKHLSYYRDNHYHCYRENLVSDAVQGTFVVLCSLCVFISLVWLREQLVHGGIPVWLQNNAQAAAHDAEVSAIICPHQLLSFSYFL